MDEERQELREIVAGLRAHLEARGRQGVAGVPCGPCPRSGIPVPSGSGGAEVEPPAPTRRGAAGLTAVRTALGDCQRCPLARGRTHIVFGAGNPDAHLVFVGEAPGAEEDARGEPFVGAAGQLLTKMIEAMGRRREDVYICNVLKCRPPGNRDPEPVEVAACEPFLEQQLAAIQPRIIVALGRFAAHLLCGEQTPITRLRGHLRRFQGIPVMPTYHPSFLLRDESRKREAWQDLKEVMSLLRQMGT